MKLISPSGQIIDVPEAHGTILVGQKLWKEYKEPKNALQIEEVKQVDETKTPQEVKPKGRKPTK